MIKAPFTPAQAEVLKALQANPAVHGYTCPGEGIGCGERLLVPATDGWVCSCGRYSQDWAHDIQTPAGQGRPTEPPRGQTGDGPINRAA